MSGQTPGKKSSSKQQQRVPKPVDKPTPEEKSDL